MNSLSDLLTDFAREPERRPLNCDVRLVSYVSAAAREDEIATAWANRSAPSDVHALWRLSRTIRLFEDVEFGQWGLVTLTPGESRARTDAVRAERVRDVRGDDVVIGEFLGDQELLVFAPSESGARRVLVALPLERREEWFGVGGDLLAFLRDYYEARGEKFWERSTATD